MTGSRHRSERAFGPIHSYAKRGKPTISCDTGIEMDETPYQMTTDSLT